MDWSGFPIQERYPQRNTGGIAAVCSESLDIRQALREAFDMGVKAALEGGYRRDPVELIDAEGSNVVSIDRRRTMRRADDREAARITELDA